MEEIFEVCLPCGNKSQVPLKYKEDILKHKWYISKKYVVSFQMLPLHRFIWTLSHGVIPVGYQIDHRDNNTLNNTIGNLRLVTQRDQALNRSKADNTTSKHRGVDFRKKKNHYRVRFCGRYLGHRDTEDEAGYLWDTYVFQQPEYKNGTVKLNMPENIDRYAQEPIIVLKPKKTRKINPKAPVSKNHVVRLNGNTVICRTHKGVELTLDPEDFTKLEFITITTRGKSHRVTIDEKQMSLQRFIMNVSDPNLQVGRKNDDPNDFTKDNLFVDTIQNVGQAKGKKRGTSSDFYGVHEDESRGDYIACIKHKGKQHSKRFKADEEVDAAIYRDLYILCRLPAGSRYRINFDWSNEQKLEEWKTYFGF